MKVSAKCKYGLNIMVTLAHYYSEGPVKRKVISGAGGVSNAYLENIIISLKAGNLLKTTRGANGGIMLESEPSKTSMLQIVKALEGTIAPVECLEEGSACEKNDTCASRKAWKKLYDTQVAMLGSVSLQDLLEMEKESTGYMYSI